MKYYIIAGEASGDLHGSNLIHGLTTLDKGAQIRFWGGELMAQAAGASGTLVRHYKDGAVMGFTDVLAKIGMLLGNVRFCKNDIIAWKPDVVILIDYPGFNFKIAEFAHGKGFRVFYYIAPKTWASREGRNRKLRRYVDRLFIIFPFERSYFNEHGIPYTYAGNPLLDAVDNHRYSPVCEGRSIAILAGSRKSETERMMPVCMEVADRFAADKSLKDYTFIVAAAPSRNAAEYEKYIGGRPNVRLVSGRTYDALRFADAAVINSGTASLEAVLIRTPQIVCWSCSKLTAFVARNILHVLDKVKFISLGNIIIGREAFPELIQENFTADKVYDRLKRLITDKTYRAGMLSDYECIRKNLGGTGASAAVAREMIGMLEGKMV
ncbi:MAG: lipid-A-disaccharide synthase [Bacteroidales bacterium]|nr:lipid-A-disaccharide synthase [Bacteroidales bacterium]